MPAFDGSVLEAATLTYDLTTTRGERTSTNTATVTIAKGTHEGQPAWRIENESDRGGTESTGVLHLDRSTLHPLAHRAGEGLFDLQYQDDVVTGTVGAGEQSTAIDTSLGASVLDEKSPNLEMALAGLRLEPGQSFAVRTFSPLGPSVNVVTLAVTGTESVDVPAGTIETYVVSMESSSGRTSTSGTMHLRERAPHYLVRGEATIQAGGMSMTLTRELTAWKGK
jgi:Protein of unknown function (DUF3108).